MKRFKIIYFICFIFAIFFSTNVYREDKICFDDNNLYDAIINDTDFNHDDNCVYVNDIKSIKSLDFDGYEVKSLNGLSNFKYLESLNLNNNQIDNLDDINKLVNLKYFDFSRNNTGSINSYISNLNLIGNDAPVQLINVTNSFKSINKVIYVFGIILIIFGLIILKYSKE